MPAPVKLCHVLNASGPTRWEMIGTTSIASAQDRELLRVRPADIGNPLPGDELLCILHLRFGNVDLSGITGGPGPKSAELHIRPTWGWAHVHSYSQYFLREGDWSIPPMRDAQPDNALTHCVVWTQTTPNGVDPIQVAGRMGWSPGFFADLPITAEIEDLTLTVWNLGELTRQGIPYGTYYVVSPTTLQQTSVALTGPQPLPVPPSGTATYLVYGGVTYEPGSPHDPSLFRLQFAGVSKATAEWGSHARADNPAVSHPYRQCHGIASVVEVPAGAGAVTVQMRGRDGYAPSANAKAGIAHFTALHWIQLDALDPRWIEYAAPDIGAGAARIYTPTLGPEANQPDVVSVSHAPEIGQERVAMGWAVPLNEHSPELTIGFAASVKLNGAIQLAANAQPQLYVLQTDRADRMPDYQTAPYRTGSAAYIASHEGAINPLDDPLSSINVPLRITEQRKFFAGSNLLLTFDAAVGALKVKPDPDPIGPIVYLAQDGESLDPASLPRLSYPPSGVTSGRRINRSAKITTYDGRLITWGAFLQPRDTWTLRWTCKVGVAQPEIPRRDAVLAELLGLDDGAFALPHPLTGELRAFVLNGASIRYEPVSGAVWRIEAEVVELVWFGGAP